MPQSNDPSLGINSWLEDELYYQYQFDKKSVDERWTELFQQEGHGGGAPAAEQAASGNSSVAVAEPPPVMPESAQAPAPMQSAPPLPATPAPMPASPANGTPSNAVATTPKLPARQETVTAGPGEQLIPLRGAAAKIAENMVASLSIPVATSQRIIPVKVIDENRRTLNEARAAAGKSKISYTHLIGWAVVKAGGDTWFVIVPDRLGTHQRQRDTTRLVTEAGGKVLGGAVHPLLSTTDFSEVLRQAQQSGAKVLALASFGDDLANTLKQARAMNMHKAMRFAREGLCGPPEHVLIDGLPVSPFPLPQTAIIDGDCISLSIAAASVIAKVTRDAIMRDFCARFPDYCFSQHKGYGTELHLIKLHEHGPCPIHRGEGRGRTFSVNLEAQGFTGFNKTCGQHGDVIDLWASVKGMSLREAALDLVQTFGLETREQRRGTVKHGCWRLRPALAARPGLAQTAR